MATNLIDTAENLITPDVASKISFIIGETPAKTQQAIGTGVHPLAGIGLTTLDCRVISTRILGACWPVAARLIAC